MVTQTLGAMQNWSMRITHVIDHAAREAGNREIVTRWADGSETRTDWAGIRRDALKMAQALTALGIKPGERVASLAMNHSRHLVSWDGVAGMGGVLHTGNPRLFEDQLEYIVTHAEDRVLLYDAAFQPIVDKMKDRWPTVEHYICYDSGDVNPSFRRPPRDCDRKDAPQSGRYGPNPWPNTGRPKACGNGLHDRAVHRRCLTMPLRRCRVRDPKQSRVPDARALRHR